MMPFKEPDFASEGEGGNRLALESAPAPSLVRFGRAAEGHALRRIGVREKDRFIVLKLHQVDCIEATGNYSHFFIGQKTWIIRESLSNLDRRLDPRQFARIHRSWIVNLDRIVEIYLQMADAPTIVLQGGKRLPLGPTYKARLYGLLGIL